MTMKNITVNMRDADQEVYILFYVDKENKLQTLKDEAGNIQVCIDRNLAEIIAKQVSSRRGHVEVVPLINRWNNILLRIM